MQLKDIPSCAMEEIWFKAIANPVPQNTVGTIGYIDKNPSSDSFYLKLSGEVYPLETNKKHAISTFEHYIKRGSCCLAEVISVNKNGVLNLLIVFFKGGIRRTENLYLTASPNLQSQYRQSPAQGSQTTEVRNTPTLTEQTLKSFILEVPEDAHGKVSHYFIISTNHYLESDETEDTDIPAGVNELGGQRITLHGAAMRMSAAMDADGIQITRLIQSASTQKTLPYLCQGQLLLSEQKQPLSIVSATVFQKISSSIQEYLNLWDQYGHIEAEALMAKARKIGKLQIKSAVYDRGKVKLYVDKIPSELTDKDSLEIITKEPLYFQNPEMNFQEYIIKSQEMKNPEEQLSRTSFNIISIDRKPVGSSIVTNLQDLLPAGSTMILSTRGNEVQIERQRKAREIVKHGNASNPMLGEIIEGESYSEQRIKYDHVPALTPYVCDKVFKNPPTDRQKEAIDIALNTPDIALIQGPPGTGKTTVITAIIERLNEMADKNHSLRGQVLVSGFQHDAVENIVNRLRVNSLPSLKFGSRAGEEQNSQASEEKNIEAYISELACETRARNPEIEVQEQGSLLNRLVENYVASPTNGNAMSLLKEICSNPLVPVELKRLAAQQQELLKSHEKSERETKDIIPYIRALRCNEASFADDGPLRAHILLDEIGHNNILHDDERLLLENATSWFSKRKPPFLEELKLLRRTLIERCLPRPEFRIQKVNTDILNLARQANEACEKTYSNKKNAIIADFLYNLEYNPDAVREVLKNYNFVYASTTQQSDGREINNAKKEGEQDYDTVIVDEAARCGPRDLLIPMTKARNRILLVGDHRQLPHIVDEESVRKLEEGATKESVSDLLHNSMFEYMFKQLKKLEKQDGIKRTVTLDAQYRTHPLLGNFVSKAFYEDKGEGFKSPLGAEFFDHELPGIEHKAAIWIDVPYRMGAEERTPSGSRCRKAEAHAIAKYLHQYMDCEQGQKLSFGVISFYKAQVDSLLEALARYGYTERLTDSQFYQVKPELQNRLRIGTVDAFQGMEFDIVFLSVVRSPAEHIRQRINTDETSLPLSRIFGHLQSDNRMCVSMSRQKKCLIAVGDATLFDMPAAATAVPAIQQYLDLCRNSNDGAYIRYE